MPVEDAGLRADRDQQSVSEAGVLASSARQAQTQLAELSQDQIDAIVTAMAEAVTPHAETLARYGGDALGVFRAFHAAPRLEARAPRVEGIPQQPGTPGLVEDRIVAWWRGEMEGEIIDEARGEGGFGYDPHFLVPEWGKTNAEVPAEQKNSVSHRATALRAMAKSLAKS